MKILAVFPEIVTRGGCERSLLALAENFDMDIITNRFEPENTYAGWENIQDKVIVLKKPNKFLFGLELARKKFSGYDLFYSHGYFIASTIAIRNCPSILYCQTPKRDFYPPTNKFYLERMNTTKKFAFIAMLPILRAIDRLLTKRITKVVANSKNVQQRIRNCYGIPSEVVYSTCIEKVRKTKFGDFYLYPGRILPEKRVEIAVRAFENIPDKKLVVAGSSVNKHYLEKLKKIKSKNVEILTDINDREMQKLYSTCKATICLAENEDFGFIPIESMSFGKPCIVANEGGFLETIINSKNGFLIHANEASLINVIRRSEKKFDSMADFCVTEAKKYTKQNYLNCMKNVFESVLKQNK